MAEIDWVDILAQQDVEALWNRLFQLVSRHPAVRPLYFATDGAADSSQTEVNADLTQELFLELFQKQRFEHYALHSYSNTEIENELAHIEVSNLVGARLRKRYPESFRMARRVSSLLKGSSRFRRIQNNGAGYPKGPQTNPLRDPLIQEEKQTNTGSGSMLPPDALASGYVDEDLPPIKDPFGIDLDDDLSISDDKPSASKGSGARHRTGRMVHQVFGLKEWPDSKPIRDSGHFTNLAKAVPVRRRDTRIVGRSATSQLILSNPDLEQLIIEIFEAIDSPSDVRTIRQLTLSKIPLQDYNVASLDEELTSPDGTDSSLRREAVDTRVTPEQAVIQNEEDARAERLAGEFLVSLRRAVNNNHRRYARLLSTLWHCYYDPDGPSQLEIARILGVSDSLISDNRRLIEHELKKLRLTFNDGLIFSDSLKLLIGCQASPLQ